MQKYYYHGVRSQDYLPSTKLIVPQFNQLIPSHTPRPAWAGTAAASVGGYPCCCLCQPGRQQWAVAAHPASWALHGSLFYTRELSMALHVVSIMPFVTSKPKKFACGERLRAKKCITNLKLPSDLWIRGKSYWKTQATMNLPMRSERLSIKATRGHMDPNCTITFKDLLQVTHRKNLDRIRNMYQLLEQTLT